MAVFNNAIKMYSVNIFVQLENRKQWLHFGSGDGSYAVIRNSRG